MGIRRHIQYGKYVLRHKWYVMNVCFRAGLIWRGLVHDLSKFLPNEWIPYARHFHEFDGTKKTVQDKTGYYKPTDTGDEKFDFAWLLHQKRNKHHWQWWILPEDNGGMKILPMQRKYLIEMICDWIGAGRAQGVNNWQDPCDWYYKNKDKMQLHPDTQEEVESKISLIHNEYKKWYKT